MRSILALLLVALPAFAGRQFVSASSQLLILTIDPISPPLTIAAWARPAQNTAAQIIVSLIATTNATERVQLYLDGAAGGDPYTLACLSASGASAAAVGAGGTIGTWAHVAATVTSSTARSVFVNGVKASDTASVTVDGLNQLCVAARKNTSFGAYWDGTVAEVAVWNVVLTDSEIKQLADGLSPHLVRPGARVAYLPLWGASTPELELWNGYTVFHTNAPAGANGLHPPIYR